MYGSIQRSSRGQLAWRKKSHITCSHLGLIQCLAPRAKIIVSVHTFIDDFCDCTNVILPHELKQYSGMIPKQDITSIPNSL